MREFYCGDVETVHYFRPSVVTKRGKWNGKRTFREKYNTKIVRSHGWAIQYKVEEIFDLAALSYNIKNQLVYISEPDIPV